MKISVKTKNVHRKATFERINEGVNAMMAYIDLSSDIEGISSLIEMVLADEAEDGKIEQTNVVCDHRNNKISDLRKGKIKIDVCYRQRHCFNVTELNYILER